MVTSVVPASGPRGEPIGQVDAVATAGPPSTIVRALWTLFVLAGALQIVTIARANRAWLLDVLPDDAFYYLEIARRIGEGQGPTFDGINQTSGFHPLWAGLIAPLTIIIDDGEVLVKAAMVTGLVLGLVGVALVSRLVTPVAGPEAAAFGALVVVHGPGAQWLRNGMESSLVVLALALCGLALRRFDSERSAAAAVLVGVASGAAVLARTDLGIVALLVPVCMAVRARRPSVAGFWAIGGGALVIPFAAWSYAVFGHLLSVSGMVKLESTGAVAMEQWGGRLSTGYWSHVADYAARYVEEIETDLGGTIVGPHLLVLLALIGALAWWRSGRTSPDRATAGAGPAAWATAVLAAVVAAKTALDLVMLPEWAAAWSSAPARVGLGLAVGVAAWQLVRRIAARDGGLGAVAAAALVLFVLPLASFDSTSAETTAGPGWQHTLDRAVQWIRSEGPVGRYGAYDAGLIGFELGGTVEVVNLDGLVNDYEYAELLLSGASRTRLLQHDQVDYLVNRLTDAEVSELDCARPLWRSPEPVPYGGMLAYVYVLDVRGCVGVVADR